MPCTPSEKLMKLQHWAYKALKPATCGQGFEKIRQYLAVNAEKQIGGSWTAMWKRAGIPPSINCIQL